MAPMLRLCCVCLLVLASPASALEDPDTEVARRHFEKGRTFYDAHDYRHALDEFQAAKRAKPAPGLDYNIARCYDRLEEYDHAVEHYQLFLTARPEAPDAAEIKERIATLKSRIVPPEKPVQKPVVPVTPPATPEAPLLLSTPTLDNALQPSNEDLERARRRRNGAIVGGIIGGAVVIGVAVVLGVVLGRQPQGNSLTRSDLGPFTVTP
jgi:tetratricopeptide (TPR) repeat protein